MLRDLEKELLLRFGDLELKEVLGALYQVVLGVLCRVLNDYTIVQVGTEVVIEPENVHLLVI